MQITLIVLTIILGLIGYGAYYSYAVRTLNPNDASPVLTNVSIQTVFSTIRLFVVAFDAKRIADPSCNWINIILEIARWLAMFIAGTALFRIIKSVFAKGQSDVIFRHWNRKKNKVILLGNNEENVMIYNTVVNGDNPMIICDTGSETKVDPQIQLGYHYTNKDAMEIASDIVLKTLEDERLKSTIVVNTHDEARNLIICKHLSELIKENIRPDKERHMSLKEDQLTSSMAVEIERRIIARLDRLRIIVFGDQRYEEVYLRIQNESVGIIQYTNKYLLSAFSFVFEHPLTEDLPEQWVKNGCIDSDVDFNVIMLGFGENNQNLYSLQRSVNQFIQSTPGDIPVSKPVHYYLWDKECIYDNGLNHSDYRYEKDFLDDVYAGKIQKDDYLPLPNIPAITDRKVIDMNAPSFYQFIKEIVLRNPKSVNQMIVCIGNDITNIDIAQKMEAKKREWGITNLSVYVKIRDKNLLSIHDGLEHCGYIPYGYEKDNIFSLRMILHNPINEMARKRNLVYTRETYEKAGIKKTARDTAIMADYAWYTMDMNKQKSNIYAMLGLRFKLQLMGLDFVLAEEENATDSFVKNKGIHNNLEYMSIYARDDHLTFVGKQIMGMELIGYPGTDTEEDFRQDILRKNLAVQEHYRWNAYMMSCGFIPCSKMQIMNGVDKDYSLRIHGNLTKFEGLFEFRKITGERDGKSEAEKDVIRYDYQILDEAWCFLHENGYKIYRRTDRKGQ